MRVKKNKEKPGVSTLKKTILVVLFSLFLSFLPVHKSSAALWPAIDPMYQRVLDTVYDQLQGIIMGALKQAAAKMINQQVNKLVGGGSGSGAMFITNWESFLINEPKQKASLYMNDYLGKVTGGKGSFSGYASRQSGSVLGAFDSKPSDEGFFGGKVLGSADETDSKSNFSNSYYEDLLDAGKNAAEEKQDPKITLEVGPSEIFSSGNFENYNKLQYDLNNPVLMDMQIDNERQKKIEENEKIAATQSVAYQGYLGNTKNGSVVTPGSTIGQAVANAQDMGNKILAAASRPGEMISSIVSQIVTQALQQGIGAVSGMVNRQVNQVTDKAKSQLNGNLDKYGPGSMYKSGRGVNQP
jgi:hypothetical protein